MKSKSIILIIILTVLIGGLAYYFYNVNQNKNISQQSEYNTAKVGTNTNELSIENKEQNISNNINENLTNNTTSSEDNASNSTNSKERESNNETVSSAKETEIASFSTKIYTKDSSRQNNVSITCSKLNDTIVENGKTFSFCDTVGKATSSKGYQKADVFRDGETIKALGGGNCQVSTTLYNAVLKVPELKVTERHAHSNSVPYIKEGKDAAVSYGAYDFKFVNNTRKFYKN